jgi:hypothetical protein
MTKDEALKLARAYLRWIVLGISTTDGVDGQATSGVEVDKAIKEALAQPAQEPVARVAEVHMSRYTIEWTNGSLAEGTELFAAAQPAQEPDELTIAYMSGLYDGKKKRPWVGLTDKQKHEFRYSHMTTADFIVAIEAKLKEKNT